MTHHDRKGDTDLNRDALIRSALRVEWLSAGWMVIEAGAGIGAAVVAHSLTLLAFGVDSLIELASAALLLWRLNVELVRGDQFSEKTERLASKTGGALLGLLAFYVVVSAALGLWRGTGQETSVVGVWVAGTAIPVMLFLSKRKLTLAKAINSAALRADAAESITCAYLSGAVLIGLTAQWVLGAWWLDSATALVIVPFLVREAREAWEAGEAGEDHEPGCAD